MPDSFSTQFYVFGHPPTPHGARRGRTARADGARGRRGRAARRAERRAARAEGAGGRRGRTTRADGAGQAEKIMGVPYYLLINITKEMSPYMFRRF